MEKSPDQKNELEIIRKSDFIIDSNKQIGEKAKKILSVLLNELQLVRGAIILNDPVQNILTAVAQRGRINRRIVHQAFNTKRIVKQQDKVVLPIQIRNRIFGVIFMAGRKFTPTDYEIIKSAEVILDGALNSEFRSKGMRALFGKYVDEKVIRKIENHPNKHHMEGERHHCSILFADLNSFTKYSNSHVPETTICLLNDFYEAMSKVVLKLDGTVDKFIGDEIMAVFGSPLPQADHAVRAIQSALSMRERARNIIDKYKIPDGGLSVGIATGTVIAGDVGSKKMMDYTMIGSKVNLAARMTSFAPRNTIVVDQRTKDDATDFKFNELDLGEVKGFGKALKIYGVVSD